MSNKYYASAVFDAFCFSHAMAHNGSGGSLCNEINLNRDPRGHHCMFDGSSMFIIRPGEKMLQVDPGNWIVISPVGTMEVRSPKDFELSFVCKPD